MHNFDSESQFSMTSWTELENCTKKTQWFSNLSSKKGQGCSKVGRGEHAGSLPPRDTCMQCTMTIWQCVLSCSSEASFPTNFGSSEKYLINVGRHLMWTYLSSHSWRTPRQKGVQTNGPRMKRTSESHGQCSQIQSEWFHRKVCPYMV